METEGLSQSPSAGRKVVHKIFTSQERGVNTKSILHLRRKGKSRKEEKSLAFFDSRRDNCPKRGLRNILSQGGTKMKRGSPPSEGRKK